ncbi:MAG: HlyC/CorC family transporter [Pseudomonadales bacterium]|nr:HlyC/CorC family transporter [Pseudomonadales bacterium]
MVSSSPSGLLLTLVLAITGSAFFSAAETGIMTANRYRLRHQANLGHRRAQRILDLLAQPQRLLTLILIGNSAMNIMAGSMATLLGLKLHGDAGIAISTGILTVMLLIFGEVGPKTFAAAHPEKVAYPAAFVLTWLLKVTHPLVTGVNALASFVFRFNVLNSSHQEELNSEELRSLVHDSGHVLPNQRRGMLLGVLDLETICVDDIMIPRQDVVGINIEDDVESIVLQLRSVQHTRLPVFKGELNNCIGILHVRHTTRFLQSDNLTRAEILQHVREPYYVPEGTSLPAQLRNFQKQRQRMGLVVDEYGDIQGVVTLEDILEEIVGDFTTSVGDHSKSLVAQPDGSFLLDGSISLRELNRRLHWQLPQDGARTLSGLIIEYLDVIPESPLSLRIENYVIEVLQVRDNTIRSARVKLWEN